MIFIFFLGCTFASHVLTVRNFVPADRDILLDMFRMANPDSTEHPHAFEYILEFQSEDSSQRLFHALQALRDHEVMHNFSVSLQTSGEIETLRVEEEARKLAEQVLQETEEVYANDFPALNGIPKRKGRGNGKRNSASQEQDTGKGEHHKTEGSPERASTSDSENSTSPGPSSSSTSDAEPNAETQRAPENFDDPTRLASEGLLFDKTKHNMVFKEIWDLINDAKSEKALDSCYRKSSRLFHPDICGGDSSKFIFFKDVYDARKSKFQQKNFVDLNYAIREIRRLMERQLNMRIEEQSIEHFRQQVLATFGDSDEYVNDYLGVCIGELEKAMAQQLSLPRLIVQHSSSMALRKLVMKFGRLAKGLFVHNGHVIGKNGSLWYQVVNHDVYNLEIHFYNGRDLVNKLYLGLDGSWKWMDRNGNQPDGGSLGDLIAGAHWLYDHNTAQDEFVFDSEDVAAKVMRMLDSVKEFFEIRKITKSH